VRCNIGELDLRQQLYFYPARAEQQVENKVGTLPKTKQKPLTAEFAEKNRRERRERQSPRIFSATSAGFLCELSG
jgi:hypothetical protein